MKVVKHDLQDAVGTLQICAGQDTGCEAAIHVMRCRFLPMTLPCPWVN